MHRRSSDAYANSQYDYWDAKILARFWNQEVGEAKARIGSKILSGPSGKLTLDLFLTDARVKAMGSVEQLELFSDAGYTYDDAKAMAS